MTLSKLDKKPVPEKIVFMQTDVPIGMHMRPHTYTLWWQESRRLIRDAL